MHADKDGEELTCSPYLTAAAAAAAAEAHADKDDVWGAEVKLFWQPEGKYLAVQVDRYTKTRKTTYTSFELFSVHKRDIPMEVRIQGFRALKLRFLSIRVCALAEEET